MTLPTIPTIPPGVKILAAILLMAAIVGAIYSYGQQQFGLGKQAERADWLARENKELTAANQKITKLEEQYRKQEQRHAQAMADASTQYQEDLKNAQANKDRIIANLRTGDIRLRIPVAATGKAGGNIPAEALSSATGRDDQAHAELSPEAAEFLVGLVDECDGVVHQLTAAQRVIIEDRTQ